MLRKEKVVGKFVEFFGEGAASLSVPDRATIAQHGAGVRRDDGLLPGRRGDGRLPARDRPHRRRRSTRSQRTSRRRACSACRAPGDIDYTKTLELDLSTITPSRRGPEASAGPHRARRASKRDVHRAASASRSADERLRAVAATSSRDALSRRCRCVAGGGGAISDAQHARRRANGSRATDVEMVEQPSDARPRRADATPKPCRHRQRRRADRRDHVVHEHVESERAARRRPAGEEGGRARAARSSRTSRPRSRPARASSPTT